MRVLGLMPALFLIGCAHTGAKTQPQTPTQRAGAALVASEKCGGNLTNEMYGILAAAVKQEGTGAMKAAEYHYRALWVEAGLDSDSAQHDGMCAQIFRNGWLQ